MYMFVVILCPFTVCVGGGLFLFWWGEGFIFFKKNYFFCQSPLAPNFFGLTH